MAATEVRAPGLLLVAVVLAAKSWILWSPGPLHSWSLLFAPMLARWAMVVIAFSARRAREGSPGPRYDPGITFQEFGWASVVTTGSMLVALDAVGLVAILGVAAVSVILRLCLHRWLGGIHTTALRAGGEIAEIAALGLFALFRLR
jgi:cobalamin synthase